jgi:peptidoglycan hydrolase-like protein with peptidoglycan-binding domain
MKKLALAAASVLALSGAAMAQTTTPPSTPSTQTPPSATMGSPGHLSQDQVKQVQQHLKSAGLYKGEVDGEIGPETKHAISQFQQQNGLNQTGTLDQQTISALNSSQNSAGSSAGTSSSAGSQPSSTSTGTGAPLNPSQAPSTGR